MRAHLLAVFFCYSLIIPLPGYAQMFSASGVVKNIHSGDVEKNVTVYDSVSGIGTITNNQGYFRLLLRTGNTEIKFSRVGLQSYTAVFELVADTVLSVELAPADTQIINMVAAGKINNDQEKPLQPEKKAVKRRKE